MSERGKKNTATEFPGSATVSGAGESVSLSRTSQQKPGSGVEYYRRRLPHFENPWTIYAITFSTRERRKLTPFVRTIVFDALRHFHGRRYELFATAVMPDHVHILLQPLPKDSSAGEPTFWRISELTHSLKSFTAHEINRVEGTRGQVWENEVFDRYIRSDQDLEEKFQYILRNPWDSGIVSPTEDYPWIWTQEDEASVERKQSSSRRDAATSARDLRAPQSNEARALPRS